MCKLLRASFYRLRRSRALWLCMAAAFALSALFQLRIGADNESMNTLDVICLQVFPFLLSCMRTLSACSWGWSIRTARCAIS